MIKLVYHKLAYHELYQTLKLDQVYQLYVIYQKVINLNNLDPYLVHLSGLLHLILKAEVQL